MPDILKASARFKSQLLKGNDKALRQIYRTYARSWNKLQGDLDAITRKIEAAQKLGQNIELMHPSWKPLRDRYTQLMWQCDKELMHCSKYVSGLVGLQQETGVTLARDHSQALMSQSLGPMPKELVQAGYSVSWNQVPHSALKNLVGFLADGSPLDYKFAQMATSTVQGIKDVMLSGIAAGENPRKMAREIQRTYNGAMSNALTVCRTEVMRSYREASAENYRANDDIISSWIWSCARSSSTCAACWAMDGTEHPLSESLCDHPSGRCAAIPKTKSWKELFPDKDLSHIKETSVQPWDSETHFAKLSEADQRKVLENTKYNLYADGKIKLSDMASVRKSSVWGDSHQPTSISQLIRDGKITSKEAAEARVAGGGGKKPPNDKKKILSGGDGPLSAQ